jgi:ACR3 family arsenite efflux pump ArsB
MVFVWSHLTRGEPHFTLSQVALVARRAIL